MNFVVHPMQVQMAHQYACAAALQGKFLEFKHAFWEKGFGPYAASGGKDTSSLGEDNIRAFAPSLGLDVGKLVIDANDRGCKDRVEADMQELGKLHVNGTPTLFVNGQHIGGGLGKEALQKIVDEKLKIARASGVPGASYYQREIYGKGERVFRSKNEKRKP